LSDCNCYLIKMNVITNNIEHVVQLCDELNVNKLYVFGSATTSNFDKNKRSDLDFKVVMNEHSDPLERGENILRLWTALEDLFNRPVDLLTDTSITNPYLKKEIEQTQQLIYDRQSEEVSV